MDDLVPPTVARTINGKRGSFQEWRKGDDAGKLDNEEKFDGDHDLARTSAFDFLINSSDRHSGNWKITSDGKMALIDNGLSFAAKEELRSYPFNEAALRRMKVPREILNWDKDKIASAMKSAGLKDHVVRFVSHRLDMLQQHARAGKTLTHLNP
jgi:hypothetical protein